MAALALAVCSSCAWGVADFLGGLKSRTMPVATVMLVAVTTGLGLATALVSVRGAGPPPPQYLALGALSAVLGSIGLAAFYRGLAIGTMSVVAPIAATGAIVPIAFGLASGERPEAIQVAGALAAIAGVVLAARQPPDRDESGGGVSAGADAGPAMPSPAVSVLDATAATPAPARRVVPGAGLALVAAVGLGSFLVALDAASEADFAWAILTNRAVSLVLVAGAALALRARPPVGVRDALPAVAVGVLETTANTLIAVATTLGFVSLVGVLASLYPVATILLARVWLGERVAPVQQLGTVTALAGVILIAAGAG